MSTAGDVGRASPPPPGSVLAHIRSLRSSLLPAERSVAEVFLSRPADVIEMSSGEVAEAARTSRATVVRAAQSLGFSGYQQLRVMVARDLGSGGAPGAAATVDGTGTAATRVRATFQAVAESLPAMDTLLDDEQLDQTIAVLAAARRVLVVGNGLSAPLAQLFAHRLVALGRAADAPVDVISQQVAASHLREDDVFVAVSGSGANSSTVRAAEAAARAGARLVVVTAFARSALTAIAATTLVVGMRDPTFREELTVTTRIPQLILIEGLVSGLAHQLGDEAETAHAATVTVLAANLVE